MIKRFCAVVCVLLGATSVNQAIANDYASDTRISKLCDSRGREAALDVFRVLASYRDKRIEVREGHNKVEFFRKSQGENSADYKHAKSMLEMYVGLLNITQNFVPRHKQTFLKYESKKFGQRWAKVANNIWDAVADTDTEKQASEVGFRTCLQSYER